LQDDIERTHPAWKRSRLAEDLAIPQSTVAQKEETKTAKGSFFSNLFKRQFSTMGLDYRIPGIYLYGGSGCGKSFLSDIFFNNLSIKEKQRQHFH
jgi:predicted ATPase